MIDYKLKLRNLDSSDPLGSSGNWNTSIFFVCKVVYDESRKRELQRRLIYEYRVDDRLKTKNEESTRYLHVVYYESIKRNLK